MKLEEKSAVADLDKIIFFKSVSIKTGDHPFM